MYTLKAILAILLLLLSGCANFNSVFRDFDVSDGTGAMIDIKQRAIIVAPVTNHKPDGTTTNNMVVCAEPSPDALSAYAAELAAEASSPGKASARFAAAFQESSSSVGLRTQSIQLLRDSLYRLCEGYMSGALDKAQYGILVRRYQKYMVALLGIEQLTRTARAPAITINTLGSAQLARSISVMQEEIDALDKKVSALNEVNKKLEEESKKSETTVERKKEITTLVDANKKTIFSDEKKKSAIFDGIKGARGLAVKGSAVAVVSDVGMMSNPAGQYPQGVSKAVMNIVLNILKTDDYGQLCFAYLRHGIPNTSGKASNALVDACNTFVDARANHARMQNEVVAKKLKYIEGSSLSDDEKLELINKIDLSGLNDGSSSLFSIDGMSDSMFMGRREESENQDPKKPPQRNAKPLY